MSNTVCRVSKRFWRKLVASLSPKSNHADEEPSNAILSNSSDDLAVDQRPGGNRSSNVLSTNPKDMDVDITCVSDTSNNALDGAPTSTRLSYSDAGKEKRPWTTRQAYFALMGGFELHVSTKHGDQSLPADKNFRITGDGFRFLAQFPEAEDDQFHLPAAEIDARSRTESMGKALTVIVTSIFLFYLCSRFGEALPLCLLEIYTALHALCSVATYVWWWGKPYDVALPVTVKLPLLKPAIAEHWMRNHKSSLGSTWDSQARQYLASKPESTRAKSYQGPEGDLDVLKLTGRQDEDTTTNDRQEFVSVCLSDTWSIEEAPSLSDLGFTTRSQIPIRMFKPTTKDAWHMLWNCDSLFWQCTLAPYVLLQSLFPFLPRTLASQIAWPRTPQSQDFECYDADPPSGSDSTQEPALPLQSNAAQVAPVLTQFSKQEERLFELAAQSIRMRAAQKEQYGPLVVEDTVSNLPSLTPTFDEFRTASDAEADHERRERWFRHSVARACLFMLIFGGLLTGTGWHLFYANPTHQLLFRIAVLVYTFHVLVMCCAIWARRIIGALMDSAAKYRTRKSKLGRTLYAASLVVIVVGVACAPVFVASSMLVIFEAFYSLWHLPARAYTQPELAAHLPLIA